MGFHNFLKDISPKMNIRAQQEFEPANYDVTTLYVSHAATGTHLNQEGLICYKTDKTIQLKGICAKVNVIAQ